MWVQPQLPLGQGPPLQLEDPSLKPEPFPSPPLPPPPRPLGSFCNAPGEGSQGWRGGGVLGCVGEEVPPIGTQGQPHIGVSSQTHILVCTQWKCVEIRELNVQQLWCGLQIGDKCSCQRAPLPSQEDTATLAGDNPQRTKTNRRETAPPRRRRPSSVSSEHKPIQVRTP